MIGDLAYYAQLVLESAVGVFGIRLYEEPRYDVLAELPGGVEVRRYGPRLAAEVALPGEGAQARDEAFRRLFRYIAGANDGAGKIAMTAPVATESRGEKIAMTTPVDTSAADGVVRMRFFLPASIPPALAPRPTDPQVRLVQLPEETTAALRFSGRGRNESVAERSAELLRALAATPWRPSGEPGALFYDAPFTVPFLRRNEVAVRVEPR